MKMAPGSFKKTINGLLASFAIAVSSFAVGCEHAGRGGSSSTTTGVPRVGILAGGYLNDGDAEKTADGDRDERTPSREDTDGDSTDEYEAAYGNARYHDSDDAHVLSYGHAAGPATRRAISALIRRYYTAAATEDGEVACSMLLPSFAKSVREDYGQGSAGPAYLRAGTSCQTVMALLFRHWHSRLTVPVTVTGVRVDGHEADALLGSARISAGSLALLRERGTWVVDGLFGGALP